MASDRVLSYTIASDKIESKFQQACKVSFTSEDVLNLFQTLRVSLKRANLIKYLYKHDFFYNCCFDCKKTFSACSVGGEDLEKVINFGSKYIIFHRSL